MAFCLSHVNVETDENNVNMEDLNKMKVTELKQALKDRNLPSSGTKPELVKRLAVALGATEESTDAGLEDSLQGIDEILNEDTDPPFPKKTNPPEPAPTDTAANVDATAKAEIPGSKGVTEKNDNLTTVDEAGDKIAKPVEVSKLSEAERLKLRAEKFGVVSVEAKKELRAQRFGLPSTGNGKPGVLGTATVDMEKLKKRAERFGTVVATSLTKVEEDERKRKRAERFGASTAVSTNTSNVLISDDAEAKKRKRAERFGLTT